MARTDTLEHYLTDVADAIRAKTGSSDPIQASSFDTAIGSIPSGGSGYTGHADQVGLLALGWTQSEIDDFQQNGVFWDAEDDANYAVSQDEINATTFNHVRFTGLSSSGAVTGYRLYAIVGSNVSMTNRNSFAGLCNNNKNLRYIQSLNFSTITSGAEYMFAQCCNLRKLDGLNISKVNSFTFAFEMCTNLREIKNLVVSENAIPTTNAFNACYSLEKISCNTIKTSNANTMFRDCHTLIRIPNVDFSECASMQYLFYNCYALLELGELDFSAATNISNAFLYCYELRNCGGFKNLGMAYSTTASANYSNYTLNISSSTLLTHDSLMNIINNLYDIASKGCNTQKVTMGATNLAKLSADEIAIATAKGWTVS